MMIDEQNIIKKKRKIKIYRTVSLMMRNFVLYFQSLPIQIVCVLHFELK